MTTQEQINAYINSQPKSKRNDMLMLHQLIQEVHPKCELWFLDGKNCDNKIVSNPNVGYGRYTIHYADGKTKPFYQIGMSANTTGISIYIMGLNDKNYLSQTYGATLGKASVSGYCIKFKTISDIDIAELEAALRYGINSTSL